MLRNFAIACAILSATVFAGAVPARAQAVPGQPDMDALRALEQSLHPKTGSVSLSGAHASLDLGEAYYFLNADEARRVLVDAWGNPPEAANDVLGMIFPAGVSPLSDTWGAVITYDADGYVSDDDATKIDYDQVLGGMRQNEASANRDLLQRGYPTSHLVGWAQSPTYDPGTHTMIWAREVRFSDVEENTLNYDVRLLGRRGVLSLNVVASMSDLAEVGAAAEALRQTATFDEGARYADFRAGDQKAAYGLAGLVAGGAGLAVAKKAGLLGILLLVLKKGWIVLAAAGSAILAWLRRVFGGRSLGRGPSNYRAPAVEAPVPSAEATDVADAGARDP